MTTRVAGAFGAVLLVVLMCLLGVGAASPAGAATRPSAPKITLAGIEAGGTVHLTATLTGSDAQPLAQKAVKFFFTSREFGPRRLFPLGSITTDTTGNARLTLGADADHLYKPTETGPQEFVVNYAAAGAGARLVSSATTVTITVAQSAYHPAPPKPLAGVGSDLVIVLFTIVAAIWVTLLAQVVRVLRVCRGTPQTTATSL